MLAWIGARARYVLSLGCLAALFLPDLAAFVRPALPYLVSVVLAMGMARVDLGQVLREALSIRKLSMLVSASIALMPVSAALYLGVAKLTGLPTSMQTALIYLAAAPPIASSAGLCFLLGFNARLALEVTVSATLLTPILGPLTVNWLLPVVSPLSPVLLATNLAAMIAGGIILALIIRTLIGAERIAANKLSFDGAAALTMLLFVIPLFDGVGPTMLARPGLSAGIFALSILFNLGINLSVNTAARRMTDPATAGACGILAGNRTIAMYLAALPPDPVFTAFVALYQFPMYFTPLVLQRFRV